MNHALQLENTLLEAENSRLAQEVQRLGWTSNALRRDLEACREAMAIVARDFAKRLERLDRREPHPMTPLNLRPGRTAGSGIIPAQGADQ